MTDVDWLSEEAGQFISLRAFANHRAFWHPDAKLPDWETIRSELPQLIHPNARGGTRYFITHRWDHTDHPDPSGWQLRALLNLGTHYNFDGADVCIWYDYMSLPQRRPRSGKRGRIFSAGLKNIRRTVAHCENVCLISQSDGDDKPRSLKSMLQRGWVVFELYIARSRMKRSLPLYEREPAMVDFGRTQYDLDAVVPDVQALAPFDTPQLLHRWLQNREIICTNGSDLKLLAGFLHEELTRYEAAGVAPDVKFNTRLTLSNYEIQQFSFLMANGRSMRFPEIFLDRDYEYEPRDGSWTVTLLQRPPLPKLGCEIEIGAEDVWRMRIDPLTGLSPMYPGIQFNIARDRRRMSFEVN